MRAYWNAVFCAVCLFAGLGVSNLRAQEGAIEPSTLPMTPSVLHIAQSQTVSQGSQNGFPTFLSVYKMTSYVVNNITALMC
jgi:hypothetical protein